MDEKKFWHINLKAAKGSVIFLFFVVILYAAQFYFTQLPHPLKLADPPFPKDSFVDYEETSIRTWFSGNSPSNPKSQVWRKEYLIGFGECCENLNTPEKIFAFMEDWMSSQGWVQWKEVGDPCSNMDVSEFLEWETGYVPYVPVGTKNLLTAPSVCIAVWPWKDNDIFAVLIVTSKK